MSRAAVILTVLAAAAVAQPLPPSLRVLIRTLQTAVDWRQRQDAARQLGVIGDRRALESLATAARHDTMPEVRRSAMLAIRQIEGGGRPPVADPNVTLVESWYQRYLGRSADPPGLASSVDQLRRGETPNEVLVRMILGSDEFWDRAGRTPRGFVIRLFQTALRRGPSPREINEWVRRFGLHGDRQATSRQFLTVHAREFSI